MSKSINELAPTGCCDSEGEMIYVGGRVRGGTCNEECHGKWVDYEVKQQGLTPILSYLISEKGQVLPVGHTACILANEYDHKDFVFADDLSKLTPIDRNLIYMGEITNA